MHVSTRLIHADEPHRPSHALTPPIAQPTNAEIPTAGEFAEIATTPLHPGMYNRHGNANHEQAAAILAELEGAELGLLTSAGMGAATTAILTLLKAGDHVIGQRSSYAGVISWMRTLMPRFGVEVTIVDQTDVWDRAQTVGAVLSPFNAWLLLRGLRTLALRVERHNHNAQTLAEALQEHPRIAKVHYPGLPTHPGHAIATRQMSGFGGVLSFELRDGYGAADEFIANLSLAKRAASLGHVGSLVVHPAALWAHTLTPEQLEVAGVSPGLVRFATGIEHAGDLLADVLAALE